MFERKKKITFYHFKYLQWRRMFVKII